MGCGTGILAILANQLGATSILAIDIDDWSIENCIENCSANNAKNIRVKKGDSIDLETEQPFDIILANINKNVLKQHLPIYSKKLKPNGTLLLSGFFTPDSEELKLIAKENNLTYILEKSDKEWTILEFKRN